MGPLAFPNVVIGIFFHGCSGDHPEPSQRKQRKEERNVSATDAEKATAATSGSINELFHEAMRSYEKALKSGIQLQEESVNIWKDLLTKLGSPEELSPCLRSRGTRRIEMNAKGDISHGRRSLAKKGKSDIFPGSPPSPTGSAAKPHAAFPLTPS